VPPDLSRSPLNDSPLEDDMSAQGSESNIVHPARALPRKYIEPILYLADQMSAADGKVLPKERKMVEELAKAASYKDFRHEDWYRKLSEEKACQAIAIDSARQGLLVVLALLLKADEARKDTEHAYFTKIRNLVGGDPVHVPVDLEAHKKLALEYIAG
jgi:hypothetical protein